MTIDDLGNVAAPDICKAANPELLTAIGAPDPADDKVLVGEYTNSKKQLFKVRVRAPDIADARRFFDEVKLCLEVITTNTVPLADGVETTREADEVSLLGQIAAELGTDPTDADVDQVRRILDSLEADRPDNINARQIEIIPELECAGDICAGDVRLGEPATVYFVVDPVSLKKGNLASVAANQPDWYSIKTSSNLSVLLYCGRGKVSAVIQKVNPKRDVSTGSASEGNYAALDPVANPLGTGHRLVVSHVRPLGDVAKYDLWGTWQQEKWGK